MIPYIITDKSITVVVNGKSLTMESTNPSFQKAKDTIVAEKWDEVVFRINAGEMPPEKEPQPSALEIGSIAETLTKRIREGTAARMAKRGKVQQYRLSREEYAHTVYDLLGVVFDVEAPGAFNEDPRWHGFERIGSLLSTSPSHIDRYLRAADKVIELASLDSEPQSKKDPINIQIKPRPFYKFRKFWGYANKIAPAARGTFWSCVVRKENVQKSMYVQRGCVMRKEKSKMHLGGA